MEITRHFNYEVKKPHKYRTETVLRAEIWIATTLISIGVIGGLLYNWPTAQPLEVRDNPGQVEPNGGLVDDADSTFDTIVSLPEQDASTTVSIDGDEVERGDNFLLGGNSVAAYREYVKAANQDDGLVSGPLLLRMAMAAENMGDHVRAEALYQKAIKHSKLKNIRLLALSGLSRSWIAQGNFEHSFELLAEMDLLYGTPEDIDQEIRNQIHYQVSEAAQRIFLVSLDLPGTDLEELEFHWCQPNMENMLGLIDLAVTKISDDTDTPAFTLEAFADQNADADLTMVDAKTPIKTIRDLLQEISYETELTFDPSQLANVAISNRTAKLDFQSVPLAVVLDLTLSPLNLVWEQNGDRIRINHQNESKTGTAKYQLERARRLLRRVDLELPTSDRRISSMLHAGNLALLSGDLETARNRYEELQVTGVNGELAAQLNFNLAVLDRLNLNDDIAIERLYFAVDQSLNQEIQAKGYSRIARMHLEHGNTEGAIYAAERGLALATLPMMQEKTTLILARSYLLKLDAYRANKILFDNKDYIKTSTGIHLAGVYGAYARLLGKPQSEGLRDERTRLIVAMSHLMPQDTGDFIDALLVSRAFFVVGFTNKAIELSRKAMEQTRHSFWQRRAAYDLATLLFGSGQMEEALEAYEVIYQNDPLQSTTQADQYSIIAQLKSADICLMQSQPENCLKHCQQLWNWELNDDQKSQTLTLMGRAYRKMGRHHTAAVCFAGMIPKPESSTQQNGNEVNAP